MSIVVVRCGTPASLDRVTYKIYEDGNALFTALNSGALDLVAHLTSDPECHVHNMLFRGQLFAGTHCEGDVVSEFHCGFLFKCKKTTSGGRFLRLAEVAS